MQLIGSKYTGVIDTYMCNSICHLLLTFICFRFMPALNIGSAEIFIFINDEDDKNEETFCVKVTYNTDE